MKYTLENQTLRLTVSAKGAELFDLRRTAAPEQPLLWDGKQDVWPRRAPVCFPWCGKPEEGWYEAEGRRYTAPQHGFVRDLEHTLTEQTADSLTFRLDWPGDEETCPWPFFFETRHVLEADGVATTCTAVNRGDRPMPVQLGFHPGLACPFLPGAPLSAFQIRFEAPEAPGGSRIFPLDPHVFDNDSICFPDLTSRWIQVEEIATGRHIRVDTQGFPFVLLWSKPGIPGFVCIEPWLGYVGPGHDLAARPGARLLAPGEARAATQHITLALD